MSSSIRWPMLRWYGLLMLGVLSTFGGLLFWQVQKMTWQGVDADLHSHAKAISASLARDRQDGWELELSFEYLHEMSEPTYCTVLDGDGAILFHHGMGVPKAGVGPLGVTMTGDVRTIEILGRDGARVRVGASVASESAFLYRLLLGILGSGLAVLAFGICGGWWLANRCLFPIKELTMAASQVGPRDLNSRLDTQAAPAELQELSEAFNDSLDRLALAFDARRKFTANAAHELRTPIATLRAQAQSALLSERTPEEYRETLAACVRASQRMSGLVDGLLSLASVDGDTSLSDCEHVDLRSLVETATEGWRSNADDASVLLSCNASDVSVRGDHRLLVNVVDNLVDNAMRHSDADGRIDVRLRGDGDSAILSVSDLGTGIPSEALPHVFERFYRADFARSRTQGGFGLGLAITRRIVEVHGGTIGVESEWGRGSTFTVRLPAAGMAV